LGALRRRNRVFYQICWLQRILDGYGMARAELGVPRSQQEHDLNGFQEWIQERYQITSTHGWDSIILFFSVDEKDALDKFFKLLEEFLNQAKIAEDKET